MTQIKRVVTGGVDAHADNHHAVALDERGRLLGDAVFPTSRRGYRELLGWLEGFGQVRLVGIESTGAYAAALVRSLSAQGIAVVEVNQPHAHSRRRRGKSDPLDAEAAARKALAGEATVVPKYTSGIVESIRQLRVAREGAVKARTAALNQLSVLLVTAPGELRQQLAVRKTTRGKVSLCLRLRPDAAQTQNRCKRPSSLCAASLSAPASSRSKSACSTRTSLGSSPPPHHEQPARSASRPSTAASCSSAPARTSNDSATRPPSPASAAPAQSPPPPAAPPDTGSTATATAKQTGRST
jgi:transposase